MISATAPSLDLPTLAARARGLGTHLLRRAELEELAKARDVAAIARALAGSGRVTEPIDEGGGAPAIELALRHDAAKRLHVLTLWAGAGPALDVFHAEQDRRALRAMLRGALQGASAESRLAGLLPTPRLPERALVELARQPTPARVAALLVVLRHPDAEALSKRTAVVSPVLFELELALIRGYASRSVRAAAAGDENLRAHVAGRLDACNAALALELAAGARDVEPASCFVEGGRALALGELVRAASARSREEAATRLARAARGTALAPVLRDARGDAARIERASLVHALAAQRRQARLDPIGSGALLGYLLREEAQAVDLRRLLWGAALSAPASIVVPELVTPWS
jgi:vacuolar-type H+-ATPase subunit C/Vma6